MADAVRASAALKIYVCNVMTQPGETDGYTAADHVEAVHRHIGPRFFDAVIVNNELPTPSVQQKYAEEGAEPVLPDIERLRRYGCEVVTANLLQFRTVLRHDAAKLSRLIVRLVQERKRRRQSG
jgi:uncharacterized cofD-like protein